MHLFAITSGFQDQLCVQSTRLGRFFGMPKNTGFFEEPVFLVLPNPKYRKTGKRQKIREPK